MWRVIVVAFALLVAPVASLSEDVPCECPKLSCDPCFKEQGVSFYSEKCGPGGMRIRSCARPTCVPEDPLPKSCDMAMLQGKKKGSGLATVSRGLASGQKAKIVDKAVSRKLAEFKKEIRGPQVAKVHTVKGPARLLLPDGSSKKIMKGAGIHERDIVKTSLRGHVKILFSDGNIANIKPNSELKLEHYEMGEKKKAILNLIKGKVRSKVRNKVNGKTGYYRVQTKGAVAGVRGTDFVVEYTDTDRIVTKVTTFEGSVNLSGDQSDDSVEIDAGKQASFIVASHERSEVFSDEEISEFVARGYMTPVYSLSKAELEQLDKLTEVGTPVARNIASESMVQKSSGSVCQSPSGDINQCYWYCQNNPKGASRCMTERAEVSCIRKKCDGNGNWSDESRLPASLYDRCRPQGFRVEPCDY